MFYMRLVNLFDSDFLYSTFLLVQIKVGSYKVAGKHALTATRGINNFDTFHSDNYKCSRTAPTILFGLLYVTGNCWI